MLRSIGGLKTVWVDGVNPETGETSRVPVLVGKRMRLKERYLLFFQDMIDKLSCDPRMTGERARVFLLLLCRCDWENWLYIQQKEIALKAGLHPAQVSRAIRFLVQVGVVLTGPSLGRAHAYKLNSHYVYKGKLVNLAQHRRKESQYG